MANVPVLNIGGTDYNVKDAEARNQITDLKSALSENVVDIFSFLHKDNFPYTSNGVTVTHPKERTFHFEGTISGTSFVSLYSNVNTLPSQLVPGGTYYMVVKGATETQRIYFEVLGFKNGSTQQSFTGMKYSDGVYKFTIPSDWVGGVYVRAGWLNAYSGTVVNESVEWTLYTAPLNGDETSEVAAYLDKWAMKYVKDPNGDLYDTCDDVPSGTIIFVSSSGGVRSIPDAPIVGTLACLGEPSWRVQIMFSWSDAETQILTRSLGRNGWSDWFNNNNNNMRILGWLDSANPDQDDLDDLSDNGVWYVSTSGGQSGINSYPYDCPGMVQNYTANANIKWQIVYPWNVSSRLPKIRCKQNGTWTSWADIGGGGQTTTITQEVSRDTYNNEYNISCSPQITVDDNGWLQPVDTNTQSETGKTDMTSAIMAMLNDTGYCHLAPGIYYVSGNINMPADSMIEGCGKQTIIRLLQSTESGYIVRMHTRSTLKNVCLSGGYSAGDISNGNIGGRKGIQYIGNRDGQDSGVTPTTCTLCQIEGCWFENLDSGFYGYNAGGGLQEGVEMSNCYFTRCKAGINIDYWTEYCKFTNCVTFQCYYACINNGGNNVFTACTFHGVIGFLIDNSSGTKANSAHGTVNGCTFNHIDNMNNPSQLGKGYAIKVIDTNAGFVFANCQLWYGRVYVENSAGVQLTGCEFGGLEDSSYPLFEFSGSSPVFVNDCLFQAQPTNVITSPVKYSNCWTYGGAAVGQ